jgi:hypothetical protein
MDIIFQHIRLYIISVLSEMILPLQGGEPADTATAPSPAIPTTQPTELTGTTPKKVDRIARIYVTITA